MKNNYDILLDSIYNKYRSYAVPNYHWWDYLNQMQITNPYYTGSAYLNMDNRFKGGVFTKSWNGNTIKFDYLVSHLDGISYNISSSLINCSIDFLITGNSISPWYSCMVFNLSYICDDFSTRIVKIADSITFNSDTKSLTRRVIADSSRNVCQDSLTGACARCRVTDWLVKDRKVQPSCQTPNACAA